MEESPAGEMAAGGGCAESFLGLPLLEAKPIIILVICSHGE